MLTLSVHAKVNLTLEVLGRRSDGYHEISSVLQTIDLVDVLSFESATEIKFVCRDPGTSQMASFEEMVLKAARLLLGEGSRGTSKVQSSTFNVESFGSAQDRPRTSNLEHRTLKGAVIRAESVAIPGGVGLGSSAGIPATVLRGLNQLWSLGFSSDDLSRLAARVGSDAPFFIYGGTALAEGRGERITLLPAPSEVQGSRFKVQGSTLNPSAPLRTGIEHRTSKKDSLCPQKKAPSGTWLVLLKPAIDPVPSKTAVMYALLDSSHFTTGVATRRLVSELRHGRPLQSSLLCNAFEGVAFDFFPQLDQYRRRFLAAGADSVHLVGAGPMLFTLVSDEAEGEALSRRLKDDGMEALLVHTTGGSRFKVQC